MADRRFDEKQIAQILHQAAQLQSTSNPDASSDGLTLAEIQRLAEEVGIEPALIARAASEVDIQSLPTGSPDRPTSILLDRAIEGQLSEEVWEDLVVRLRHYAGRPGELSENGASKEWVGRWDSGNMTLTATERDGKTRLRLMADFGNGAALAWTLGPTFGFLFGVIAGAFTFKAADSAPVAFLVAIAVMAASCLGTAMGLKPWTAKKRREIKMLFETMTAQVEGVKRSTPIEAKTENTLEVRVKLGG